MPCRPSTSTNNTLRPPAASASASEAATVDFVFVMLFGGALVGAAAAALGAPVVVQIVLAVAVALLFGARPLPALLTGAATSVALWALFDRLLDLPLPKGLLGA